MQKRANRTLKYLVGVTLTSIFFTWSCGGGGGDGGGGDGQPLAPANIDQRTAEVTTAMVLSFQQTLETVPEVDVASEESSPVARALMGAPVRSSAFLDEDADTVRAGSHAETVDCDVAGTMGLKSNWTGPDFVADDSVDACEVKDMSVTMTFDNCQLEDGTTMTGSGHSDMTGSICDPTTVSTTLTNFSIDDGETRIECDAFKADMAGLTMDELLDSPMTFKATLNGDLAVNDFSMAFKQYVWEVSGTEAMATYTVSGAIHGGCYDGWVTVTTITPLKKYNDRDCPHEGQIQLTGAGDVTVDVIYNSDGSMEIDGQHYDTCNGSQIPDQCR